jgi:valine dehydrogenase (NAD+)
MSSDILELVDDSSGHGGGDHERIAFCRDDATGLRAFICIHSTSRGPAFGGTLFYAYGSEGEALAEGLRLSEGMTFKAAAAGLPLGGGKAVIIGDPARLKTPDLLRAYGRFVEDLEGRFVTGPDVGTTSDDLDVIGGVTKHVVGRTAAAGRSGESGLATARGVFYAMLAAAVHRWGTDGLQGRTVGVEGVGEVGMQLVGLLLDEGAEVVISDPSLPAVQRLQRRYQGEVQIAASVLDAQVDVYAPCALGATLTRGALDALRASVVCGAADNQLLTSDVDAALWRRGVTWVPDFIANAGGLIQVGGELSARTVPQIQEDLWQIGTTTRDLLAASESGRIPTGAAAGEIVRARLAER